MDITEDPIEASQYAIDALDPSTPARTIKTKMMDYSTGQLVPYEFYQAEIGFMPAQRFFTKISREAKAFVSGEYGIKLGELFSRAGQIKISMPSEFDEQAVNKVVGENEQMIMAFFKLVEVTPDLLVDILALSLGVARGDVEWFKKAIEEPPHRGGFTQREGFEMLRWFIRQNAVGLRRFFEEEAKSLLDEFTLWVINGGKQPEPDPEHQEGDLNQSSTSTHGGRPSSTSSPATLASAS